MTVRALCRRVYCAVLGASLLFVGSRVTDAETPTASGSAGERTEGIWRCANHGGRNCLLFLLFMHERALDCDVCPEVVETRDIPNSALDLMTMARRLGFPLLLRAVGPGDLDALPLPAIVHLDGDDLNSGSFHVLVRVNPNVVYYLNGPAAVIGSDSRELFLRRWSGTVMIPQPATESFASWPTLVGFSIAFVLTWFRRHVQRSVHRTAIATGERAA